MMSERERSTPAIRWQGMGQQRKLDDRPQGSGGIVFALVALALILAIGFFYLTNESRGDRRADSVVNAADKVDDAARVVGDAAKNAADQLQNHD